MRSIRFFFFTTLLPVAAEVEPVQCLQTHGIQNKEQYQRQFKIKTGDLQPKMFKLLS